MKNYLIFKRRLILTKRLRVKLLVLTVILFNCCVSEYAPKTIEVEELLVVDGLITNQPGINTIKLTRSRPLRSNQYAKPVSKAIISISDDMGQVFNLKEVKDGLYVTDSLTFQGTIGRIYTLNIQTTTDSVNFSYRSTPMLLRAVPQIDSIYYEKKIFNSGFRQLIGCQIFLDTHDPSNNCKYFRWNYSETWEFHLPSIIPNRVCWISEKSKGISIHNTSILKESSIKGYLINSIPDPNDRLSIKYSLLVNQFSLNEDEFLYWENFKILSEQVGGLYDQVPSIIRNNLSCVEDPLQPVLGYFSVSAVTSKRIFIKDNFNWVYMGCQIDTIYGAAPIEIVGTRFFEIQDHSREIPPYRIITYREDCTDCRIRGTDKKPAFWDEK